MKLPKYANWFYLEGNKFRDIKDLVIDENDRHFIIDDKTSLGKIFFKAGTSRQGKRGFGMISCLTTKGLQELKELPTESYEEFVEYFSEIIGRELCDRLEQDFKKREGIQKKVKNLKREHEVELGYTRAVSEMMETPLEYLGRFFSFPTKQSKNRSLTQIEKLLNHQIFILLKILEVTNAEILTKNIRLKQRMKLGIPKVDFNIPLSWHKPTVKIKIDDEIYSIWYEFSAPHPLDAKKKLDLMKDTTRRFDIIIKRGKLKSMFLSEPEYKEIKDMNDEQILDLPNRFFKEMRKIDLLIECKEQEFDKWKNDVEKQIIPYMETYKPNKMVVISAFPIRDKNVISKLKEKGITTIAPFGFENESYDKERELREAVIDC